MTFYKLYTESEPKQRAKADYRTQFLDNFFNSKFIHALLEVKQAVSSPLPDLSVCRYTTPDV